MKKQLRKLKNRRGETITETLVALLIASIALVMLASMISSTSSIVTTSTKAMQEYYNANNRMLSHGTAATTGEGTGSGSAEGNTTGSAQITFSITGTDSTLNLEPQNVTLYENNRFEKTPVISYQVSNSN